MENTKINWATHTFNPWRGCTKVSPGCAHCYAETLSKRNPKVLGTWGRGQPRVRASADMWSAPRRWNRDARPGFHAWRPIKDFTGIGQGWTHQCLHCRSVTDTKGTQGMTDGCAGVIARPRVFCASLADWLDDEVPIEWIADLLALIHATPNLDWLLLTKRPQNFYERIQQVIEMQNFDEDGHVINWLVRWRDELAPANVWVGTTVEDQARAEERIPQLLQIPARVRFLSCEPLLEAVHLCNIPPINRDAACRTDALTGITYWPDHDSDEGPKIDWVICGGESGHGARPMHPDWARGLRDQCAEAGVPFLFKQWGQHDADGKSVGKHAAGRLLDGEEHNAFPEPDLLPAAKPTQEEAK